MKRLLMALTIAALGLAYSGTAQAFTQTTTGNMTFTATVVASCTVTTAPMDFGTINVLTGASSTTTVTVNCTSGTPYRIDMGGGLNQTVGQNGRVLKTGTAPVGATNSIRYFVYQAFVDMIDNTEWGDNGVTYCPACTPAVLGKNGTGIGANEVHTVYGSVASTTNGPGVYTDTVIVTVNY